MDYVMMNHTHVSGIASLEKLCFSAPWSENSIAYELTNPLSCWIVAEDKGALVGYVGSQSVMGEADMMNLAVAPAYRRCGVAESLVNKLVEQLRLNQVYCITLEVRASNNAAITLYEKLGFSQVGRRPGYYTTPREDALIYRKEWEV